MNRSKISTTYALELDQQDYDLLLKEPDLLRAHLSSTNAYEVEISELLSRSIYLEIEGHEDHPDSWTEIHRAIHTTLQELRNS